MIDVIHSIQESTKNYLDWLIKDISKFTLKVYIFPDDTEIRVVIVDSEDGDINDEELIPFYFSPYAEGGIYHTTALAIIHPDKDRVIPLPDGWWWDEAKIVYDISTLQQSETSKPD